MAQNPVTDKAAAMQAFLKDEPIPGLTAPASPASAPVAPVEPPNAVEAPPVAAPVPEPVARPLAPPVDPVVTPQQVAEVGFIGAKQGEAEFRIPNDVLVPLKRHDKVEWVPAEQAFREAMMGHDHKMSKQEALAQRQQFQRDQEALQVERARLAEEARWNAEETDRLRQAMADPAAYQAHQDHLAQMATNPVYRAQVEAAQRARSLEAENAVYRSRAEQAEIQRGIDTTLGVMEAMKDRYPGVSVEAVRKQYGAEVTLYEQAVASRAVQAGRPVPLVRWGEGPLTAQAIERVFQEQASILQGAVAPVNGRVAALEKELADLKAQGHAAAANAQTTHAVARAQAPNVRPAGSPPAPAAPPKERIPIRDMPDRIRQWIESK